MALGVIGMKVGMTRVFNDAGAAVPVTVLEVPANRITQLKLDAEGLKKNDGYRAVQLTIGSRRSKRVTKALSGHYAKAKVEPGRGLWEFRLEPGEGEELQVGGEIKVDIFNVGQKVDVQGRSIGKGYAGVMKRHGFRGGRKTHGNSLAHRSGGSIGQNQTPGRVFKGKRMAGHMGNVKRTTQNLEVVRVDAERNLLLIKGAVPGAKDGNLIVRASVKARSGKTGS